MFLIPSCLSVSWFMWATQGHQTTWKNNWTFLWLSQLPIFQVRSRNLGLGVLAGTKEKNTPRTGNHLYSIWGRDLYFTDSFNWKKIWNWRQSYLYSCENEELQFSWRKIRSKMVHDEIIDWIPFSSLSTSSKGPVSGVSSQVETANFGFWQVGDAHTAGRALPPHLLHVHTLSKPSVHPLQLDFLPHTEWHFQQPLQLFENFAGK